MFLITNLTTHDDWTAQNPNTIQYKIFHLMNLFKMYTRIALKTLEYRYKNGRNKTRRLNSEIQSFG